MWKWLVLALTGEAAPERTDRLPYHLLPDSVSRPSWGHPRMRIDGESVLHHGVEAIL
jgi:hypothetical protein